MDNQQVEGFVKWINEFMPESGFDPSEEFVSREKVIGLIELAFAYGEVAAFNRKEALKARTHDIRFVHDYLLENYGEAAVPEALSEDLAVYVFRCGNMEGEG